MYLWASKSAARNFNWPSAPATARPVDFRRADVRRTKGQGDPAADRDHRPRVDRAPPPDGPSASASAGRSMRKKGGRSSVIRSKAGPISPWPTGAARLWACRPRFPTTPTPPGWPRPCSAPAADTASSSTSPSAAASAGLVIDGRVYTGGGGIASEIGHLRPGLNDGDPESTVESRCSGFDLALTGREFAQQQTLATRRRRPAVSLRRAHRTTHRPHDRGRRGCRQRRGTSDLRRCAETLGWAVAQMITLVAPQIVVMGGGVSLAGETLFFAPLRRKWPVGSSRRWQSPTRSFRPRLGEEVVVHGALAVARFASRETSVAME